MPRLRVLDIGEYEGLKGSIHAITGGLVALMAAYNGAAWWRRREQHLAVNAAIYGLMTVWEIGRVLSHWRRETL